MMKALLHLRKAFSHSMNGLRETFRNEIAFRIELITAVILIPTALNFQFNRLSGLCWSVQFFWY